jgi:AraC-like DNA-binding protein
LQAIGERTHQRTCAASRWGYISLPPKQLAAYGRALVGVDLLAPPVAKILRPPLAAKAQLLRLHAQACRLAETKPDVIVHREVARALEQDMLLPLVTCLAVKDVQRVTEAKRHHSRIMVQFEDALAAHRERPLRITDLCLAIGVSEHDLRISCEDILGMSPGRYLRLRRLNMVHTALRSPDRAAASIAQTARRYGYWQPKSFAASYRQVFGETPSTTAYRSRGRDPDCPNLHRRSKRSFSP